MIPAPNAPMATANKAHFARCINFAKSDWFNFKAALKRINK